MWHRPKGLNQHRLGLSAWLKVWRNVLNLNDMTRFLAWQTNAWPARIPRTRALSRSTLRASQASLGGGGKDTVGANWYVGQHRRLDRR